MLYWAAVLFVLAVVAAALGGAVMAAAVGGAAKVLFVLGNAAGIERQTERNPLPLLTPR
jgi:uncharacterized membrane protein YtjA (UPF0391 family)